MAEKKLKGKKVILLGSGALKIGEAGEFDYSGSQAAKALREDGIDTILINPNIATIQTSYDLVSKVYFLPVTPYFVEAVIKKEKPDGILLGFGGQTALNCGLELSKNGVLKKYGVAVWGTPISSIEKTEDRLLFRSCIEKLGFKVPKSVVCKRTAEVEKIKASMVYPVIVRSGFSLGGLGSGVATNAKELLLISQKSFHLASQILIEEYLEHWKEIEYEVVRDKDDNTIIVCNMENFDPMGIHTGESIVVAPSQTLNDRQYHFLRETAIKVVKSLPIIGECNIQFALSPKDGDYKIIEVNARLSRSSALASKATGYPLAYIAAKLVLGYKLSEIPNQVTKATCAFFEPALDYTVVKIPRWDFLKFKDQDEALGSEMQSVGEVMGIGRSFEEALQKAVRSLDLDYEGVISDELDKNKILTKSIKNKYKKLNPTPSRLYNIAFNIFYGQSIEEVNSETGIDKWFLERIKGIVDCYRKMLDESAKEGMSYENLYEAKRLGFSDQQLSEIFVISSLAVRNYRKDLGVIPHVCQIDTLAGEFPAETNYLYLSYHRTEHDIERSDKKQVGVIGGGPYQIGSSVEFDWCAVNSVLVAKKMGYSPIMINCNPETVSTDYDISDKLYFEELTLERIMDIIDFEKCPVVVSVGGQIPNNLAPRLSAFDVKFLCNHPKVIDEVENRQKFSKLLDKQNIKQPSWRRLTDRKKALSFADKIGYPVLIRPSYVLSGRAMFVAYSKTSLEAYLKHGSSIINSAYPLVISKFIRGAKEVDFDAVGQNGKIIVHAISEHVEHSGVHSGDATLVLPSFSLGIKAKEEIVEVSQKIAGSLRLNGPFNIQYLVNDTTDKVDILVIEANLRASRSFPFVSKVLGVNFIKLATEIMLGKKLNPYKIKTPAYFGVKAPHFSFTRLRQVDPVLRVEMASTGEVACFGDNFHEAYLKALLSTGLNFPQKSALLSFGGDEGKKRLLASARLLYKLGYKLYATRNTAAFLRGNGIRSKFVYKVFEGKNPNVVEIIKEKKVGFVVNLSDRSDLGMKAWTKQVTDGYLIRRATVDANIPLFTKVTIASLFIETLSQYNLDNLKVKSWDEYVKIK